MRLSREEAWQAWECDCKKERRRRAIVIAIVLVFVLFVLSWGYNPLQVNTGFRPLDNLASFWVWLRTRIILLFDSTYSNADYALANQIDTEVYADAIDRFKITLMTFGAGAALGIGGSVFQTAYRNPMASPNMLGVTAGVNLGNIIIVLIYSSAAMQYIYERYKFCYALTAICVVLVLVFGRLAGDKRKNISIIEMIMVGSIISQLINTFVTYFMYNMEEEDLAIYEEISLGASLEIDETSFLLFLGVMVISIVPMLIFRYRMNVIGMEYDETHTLGLRAGIWRTIAQVLAVIMCTGAMVHCGQIGMISMVIPYVIRNWIGSDFKKLIIYSALIGGTLVMICQFIATFIYIDGEVLPATTVVNVIVTPIFMIIMAKQRSRMNNAA